jgi:plastocyanin
MNTRKQVLIMSALLLMMLAITGVYAAWYPSRAENAEEHFQELRAERGALIFARNCRTCHGDVAEGGALGGRLPAAPALDRPDLQGFIDLTPTLTADVNATATTLQVSANTGLSSGQIILIDEERMEIERIDGNTLHVVRGAGHTEAAGHLSGAAMSGQTAADLAIQKTLLTNTITCGRVGTAMPVWAQTQGGPLSAEQIEQLTVLIQDARWDLVKHEVDIEDRKNSRLTTPLDGNATRMQVTDVSVFNNGEAIRMGDERLRVVSRPQFTPNAAGELPRDRSGTITLERGILGSTPLEHSLETVIYLFPEAPSPASINQASCGQTARPAAPPGTPETIEPFTGQTVEVVAQAIAFNTREIRVQTGGQVRIRLDNRDSNVEHNVAFYQSQSSTTAPLAPGSIGTTFAGPGIDDTVFTIPAAGNYFFRCDVHPTTMTGTFVVQ